MENPELFKLVGARIKELRLQKGLSQVELVGRMQGEIDATNISRIEAGSAKFGVIDHLDSV